MTLPKKRFECLRYLVEAEDAGVHLSFRELAARMHISASNGLYVHLVPLTRDGYITREEKVRARSIRVTKKGRVAIYASERFAEEQAIEALDLCA